MNTIGFIPLRKGSKGIPGKNKRKMVGRPLFCWVLAEAIASNLDKVYVYTDDDDISRFIGREYHWTDKVEVLDRSPDSASNTASTEQAMLEFCEKVKYNFDIFCLLQATSPFTTSAEINAVLAKIKEDGHDSALSVVKTHRFVWNADGTPANYDVFDRPRRQEFEGLLIENGAIYASTQKALKASKNRLSGNIGLVEMSSESYTEIDDEQDWLVAEQLLMQRQRRQKEQDRITHLVLDVDGVFTDGCIWYDANGEMAKKFDMRDGMGLEILRQHAVDVMVMTSEQSEIVVQRMKKLKIGNVYLGVKDKYALLHNIVSKNKGSLANIAYIGDDVNDLANICSVGWSFCPKNATTAVKQQADVVLSKDSAAGAIREACEFILKYNLRYE